MSARLSQFGPALIGFLLLVQPVHAICCCGTCDSETRCCTPVSGSSPSSSCTCSGTVCVDNTGQPWRTTVLCYWNKWTHTPGPENAIDFSEGLYVCKALFVCQSWPDPNNCSGGMNGCDKDNLLVYGARCMEVGPCEEWRRR